MPLQKCPLILQLWRSPFVPASVRVIQFSDPTIFAFQCMILHASVPMPFPSQLNWSLLSSGHCIMLTLHQLGLFAPELGTQKASGDER